jgi:type II restriction enzyme
MSIEKKAKQALEKLINKSRVHLYKPIQIGEILYHHRLKKNLDFIDLESYRNSSKKWRDEVSLLLVGRKSTSSQKFQDNIFESNAITPLLLKELADLNNKGKGLVEAYIYKALEARLSSVRGVENYIKSSSAQNFSILELVTFFKNVSGLRRSIDKMYEILVYALFSTIVRYLDAQITLEIKNNDSEVLKDFQKFIKMVLGIDSGSTKIVVPASLYRAGVANAADRGLDMWSNFGPAIQVKHLTLTPEIFEDAVEDVSCDKIVIVCIDEEKNTIEALLKQVGYATKIQGIVTINDLDFWYKTCLSKKYRDNLGAKLLQDIHREFELEFPSSKEIAPFMKKRGYDKIIIPSDWKICQS